MKRFLIYLKLECKRVLRLFPGILIITFLVLSVCGLIFAKDLKGNDNFLKNKSYDIGIVYSQEDKQFLGIGFYMLEHSDEVGYICNFWEVSESEGQRMLDNDEIDVLAIFPDDYVRSLYYGIEKPITLRFGTSQSGIVSLMFSRLADTVADYMMDSKAGVYTFQNMYESWNLYYIDDANQLTEEYIIDIIGRTGVLATKSVNATDDLSAAMYYVCVGIVLLMIFWGLSCGSVLGTNKKMLPILLARQQLSQISQYFAKYLSVLILFFLNYTVIAVLSFVVMNKLKIDAVPYSFYFNLLPLLLLVCAMVLCVYEISKDGIAGMMFFFFASLILGFVSGFFYPMSYFPLWMQNLAEYLPTRIMLEYVLACMKENLTMDVCVKNALCTIFFVVATNVFLGNRVRFLLYNRKSRRVS